MTRRTVYDDTSDDFALCLFIVGDVQILGLFCPDGCYDARCSCVFESIGSLIDNLRCCSVCRDTLPTEAIAKALLCAELTSS